MSTLSAKIRRFRFWLHLTQAYAKRYQIRIIIFLLLIILLPIVLGNIWKSVSRNNVIAIGYIGSYSIDNIPTEILSLATKSLITTDKSGRPVSSLASHWTVSDDGKTFIVFLKDNLIWHDDTLVDTSNISIALNDVEITALNNKALEFKLKNPISSFLQVLDKPIFKTNSFYGTGEYIIIKIDEINSVVKRMVLRPKDSRLPGVEIKFYQSQLQAAQALKIGEIKMAKVANVSEFQSWNNLNVERSIDYSQVVTIFFNNNDPMLASKELRQALTYAINKTSFDGEPASGPISPESWSFNDKLPKYSYNTVKAKELLSKLPPQELSITLHYSPGLEQLAQQIKSDWVSIGISSNLVEVSASDDQFQALLAVNQISPDPDQYALWHSTQLSTNLTAYKNVKVDKLLEDARSTQDESIRLENYLEFQEEITADLPAAFLYHPFSYSVTYKNIQHIADLLPKNI